MCGCGNNPLVTVCQDCPPGPKGSDGITYAIKSTVEPPGANCTYGGYKIEIGPDLNKDGTPDTVTSVFYLSNGNPNSTNGATPTFVSGNVVVDPNVTAPTAEVVGTGVANQYRIDFTLPQLEDGVTPQFTVGTVTTLAPGQPVQVSVALSGIPNVYVINFAIPKGDTGPAVDFTTMTMTGVTIPSCLTGQFANGDLFKDVFTTVLNKLCQALSLNDVANFGFLATTTADVLYAEISDNDINSILTPGDRYYYLNFPNDFENGAHDNSNVFFTDTFLVPTTYPTDTALTLENLGLRNNTIFAKTITVAIVKRGVTNPDNDTVIVSQSISLPTSGVYLLGSMMTSLLAITAGEKYSARLSWTNSGGDDFDIVNGSKFSNSF